jgi:cytochrome c oxidase subunit 3
MTMGAMLIALLTGVTVWWLLIQRLQSKPWVHSGIIEPRHSVTELPAPRVGLRVFLAVVTSVFGVFVAAYVMRMSHAHGGHDWLPLSEPGLLWLNTALLVCGSIAFQRARNALESDRLQRVKGNLIAGGAFTFSFLGGQLLAWRQLATGGEIVTSGPAAAFFYLLTAVHGLHLLGGLWVWARTTTKVWGGLSASNVVEVGRIRLSVQLCTVYWHYLLLVWLALFALLLTT